MEPNLLCSEDQANSAVCACFCRFPLPLVCKACLPKHSMDTDLLQHFHLPLYASNWIDSQLVKDRYRQWLFKLHGAYVTLKRNADEMSRFEERLEAARLEAIYCFTQELNTRCSEATDLLHTLRSDFNSLLQAALKDVCEHAVEQWSPESGSIAEMIWNHDGESSLCVFRGWADTMKESLTSSFQIFIETGLPSLAQFNRTAEGSEMQRLNTDLAEARKQIEILEAEKKTLIDENQSLVVKCELLWKEMLGLKGGSQEKIREKAESENREKLTGEKRAGSRTETAPLLKKASDAKQSQRAESTSEILSFKPQIIAEDSTNSELLNQILFRTISANPAASTKSCVCQTCHVAYTPLDRNWQCPSLCECKICSATSIISLCHKACRYCLQEFPKNTTKKMSQSYCRCHVCGLAMNWEDMIKSAYCMLCKGCTRVLEPGNIAVCGECNMQFALSPEEARQLACVSRIQRTACCNFDSDVLPFSELACSHLICIRHLDALLKCRKCHTAVRRIKDLP